ncbi:MAG: hypothetical protein COZ07_08190 [Candidatus Infernicultor aquiphilus]|uniref:Uncharacterized protein n=1 Tax=Candidatus Infernicultor aquiphilus TaxID=1805029 RepID=A0A1J5GJ90_9BACT|nr:hypothetical protein [bacterium]OIP72857.1 MAG: hypothetical protein AUK42_01645 [Candidatus Atribacteria bacterium CG2_30_33_13]PIU24959.1 MAG: hypothetical protein COT11_05105 [Candidatus Atribacteria bacterium CG08_land_8_20_14_0_20_33_29]PIW12257.1 MAG: hypothetical protein COW35_02445 [Candidatus Atribacteria bacterium CG17_big_fil_post_rev_8_21_14_2_50_34_11]PIX33923.1 MAG: hypothetical protein COZ58_05585 [Candidatus Atribacteria bacterium CG_4_8_14_3_um_filter_34_18]PIY31738.1 MAG: 
MKKLITEIINKISKDTYFDMSLEKGIFLIIESVVITAVFGIGIFLFLGIISLIISFILALAGIVNIIDEMLQISSIISIVGGLVCCVLHGATKGVRAFKEYFKKPFYKIQDRIQENEEMLRALSDDIKDHILEEEKEHAKILRDLPDDRKYDDDVYEEHDKIEYLKHVKNEIVSIYKYFKGVENITRKISDILE